MMRLLRTAHRGFTHRRRWRDRMLLVTTLAAILLLVGHLLHAPDSERPSATRRHTSNEDDDNTTYIEPIHEVLFPVKPLVIWSSNFHPTPVYDLMTLLKPLGVHFINKEVSTKYCQHFNTCSVGSHVRVVNEENFLALKDYKELIPKFYEAYKDDPEMRTVDAFLCCDPPSACEIFEQFNRSAIIVATTRYNIGRSRTYRWVDWNARITALAAQPWNVVAANNPYDAEYMRYFTGLDPQLLPSTCDYAARSAVYNPTRPGFLLWMRPRDEAFERYFLSEWQKTSSGGDAILTPLRRLYKAYEFTDLAAHRGIVHLPYQASVMATLEQYRMNIPLFFPAADLLVRWHMERFVLHERSESPPPNPRFVKKPLRGSNIPAHKSQSHRPDPNNDKDAAAVRFWLQYADYFTLPHIIIFNSTEHLSTLLRSISDDELRQISRRMRRHNINNRRQVLAKWKDNLRAIAQYSANQPH